MNDRLVVLIVEDDPNVLGTLKLFVESIPDVQVIAVNGFLQAAAEISQEHRIHLLLCDVFLGGGMDGFDVVDLAVDTYPDIAVVMMSADSRDANERLSNRYTFIQKPFGTFELISYVDEAFLRLQPMSENFER